MHGATAIGVRNNIGRLPLDAIEPNHCGAMSQFTQPSTSVHEEFNKIFAVRMIGAAAEVGSSSSKLALAFEVQGMRSRWRVVRSRADFVSLSENFANMTKLPRLPPPRRGTSGLGKWLSSVFWIFKGRRRNSSSGSGGGGITNERKIIEDENLQNFLKFLNPMRADMQIGTGSGSPTLLSSDNDETESNVSSQTSASARTSAANSVAESLDEEREAMEHELSSLSSSADPVSNDVIGTSMPSLSSVGKVKRDTSRVKMAAQTMHLKRRDSVDGIIANFVPNIVSSEMAKIKQRNEELQRRLSTEKRRWQNETKQIRSVLQQRYEGLMTAAEEDREGLEKRISELNQKNAALEDRLYRMLHEKEQQMQKEGDEEQSGRLRSQGKLTIEHPLQQEDNVDGREELYDAAISVAVKAATEAAENSASETINTLSAENVTLRNQVAELTAELRMEQQACEEIKSAMVRMKREVKRLNESRDREVTLREVAENAVFEAESEVERHKILYHKERQNRKKLNNRLSFYKQLEERLKNSAPAKSSERIQRLFNEQSTISERNMSASHSFSKVSEKSEGSNSGISQGQTHNIRSRSLSFELRDMSVSALRKLLDEHKVPHRDCLEKQELLFRAKKALKMEAEEMSEAEKSSIHEVKQNNIDNGTEREGEKKTEKKQSRENTFNISTESSQIHASEDTRESRTHLGLMYKPSPMKHFAADAMSPNIEENDLASVINNMSSANLSISHDARERPAADTLSEDAENEDSLSFRFARRSGKQKSKSKVAQEKVILSHEEKMSAAELRKQKQEALRAKRRAGKQRSGRRVNRRERQKFAADAQDWKISEATTSSPLPSSASMISPESRPQAPSSASVSDLTTDHPPAAAVVVATEAAALQSRANASRDTPSSKISGSSNGSNASANKPIEPQGTTTKFEESIPEVYGADPLAFDLPDLQEAQRIPAPAAGPDYTPSHVTNQRIEERRLREELLTKQRAERKVRQLQHAEQIRKDEARQTERVQGTIKDQVQRWASNKSLIRMLCTLEKIMPRDRISLPKLDLRLRSTAADVKKAYKQALRAVHPDKLATARVDDRVRGEFVFNALRESYAKAERLKEDKERGRSSIIGSPRSSNKRRSSGNNLSHPAWSQRW